MKAHLYVRKVIDETSDFQDGGREQYCLYFPERCVIGWRYDDRVDFFNEDPGFLKEAAKAIKTGNYRREVEIPEIKFSGIIEVGRQMNQAKMDFNARAIGLIKSLGRKV